MLLNSFDFDKIFMLLKYLSIKIFQIFQYKMNTKLMDILNNISIYQNKFIGFDILLVRRFREKYLEFVNI